MNQSYNLVIKDDVPQRFIVTNESPDQPLLGYIEKIPEDGVWAFVPMLDQWLGPISLTKLTLKLQELNNI